MRVYASLPLSGPQRAAGREVLRGAELALERRPGAAELVIADTASEDRDALAVAHAHRAAEDPDAIAYLGDFHSSQVAATAPLLGEARLLQVAPVATWTGLRGETLVRITPHDGVGARAIAAWLIEHGVTELLVVHDHDEGYGIPVARMCADAAEATGIAVRSRPVWDHDEPPEDDLGDARAVLYVGIAGSGAVELWRRLYAARPELWLLGSDGVALPWFASEMGAAEAERTRFFVPLRAPLAFYGFEAMALILDSLGGDRADVAARARNVRDRDSVLGRYSLDSKGHTTSTAYGVLRVQDAELVWESA